MRALAFCLTLPFAFGILVCGCATLQEQVQKPIHECVLLVPTGQTDLCVGQSAFLAKLIEKPPESCDEGNIFNVVPGLADKSFVSFESVAFPGYFLRHQNFRLKLHRNDGSDLFQKDATFLIVKGLADDTASSIMSYNYSSHFIAEKENGELWIIENPDKKKATFNMIQTSQ